jgi:hypothetical protein
MDLYIVPIPIFTHSFSQETQMLIELPNVNSLAISYQVKNKHKEISTIWKKKIEYDLSNNLLILAHENH